MRLPILLFAALGTLAPITQTVAQVYRYVDKSGVVHYTDQPPTKDAKPVDLPPVQVIGPIGPQGADDTPAAQVVEPGFNVTIVSPAAEETFRGDDRRLPVSVQLDRPLPEGAGLLYMLDGNAQNKGASRAFSYTLEGVERGEHLVSVALVDANGRELARSAPVIVHMKPPTVQLSQPQGKPGPKPK